MPGKGVMAEIKSLLAEGKSKEDLISLGYAKGSIYGASRQLAKEAARSNPSKTAADSGAAALQSVGSTSGEPEVSELRRAIEKTKLQNELDKVRGDTVTLEQLKAMVYVLQEWTVTNVADLGQCVLRASGEQVDDEAFQSFIRESLDELRSAKRVQ